MIKVDDYYFILPKPELSIRWHSRIYPALKHFFSPMILRGKDVESFGLGQETLNGVVKLIYLDALKRDYHFEEKDTLFKEIYFDYEKTINYFDSLWLLYVGEVYDTVNELIDDALVFKTLFDIKNTGNDSVDLWFKRYIENIQND